MRNGVKWMGLIAALVVAAWAVTPASAQHELEGKLTIPIPDGGEIYGFELFDQVDPGTQILRGGPGNGLKFWQTSGGNVPDDEVWTVNNDNDELFGNHFDGSSAGGSFFGEFTMEQDGPDPLPTDHYYINIVVDNHGNNFSPGVFNSTMNTQYNIEYQAYHGWGWGFGPNEGAHSGADVFDTTKPTFISHELNMDGGFVTDFSFTANQPSTGSYFSHGPVPNFIPGFGTPRLRLFFDRRALIEEGGDVYAEGDVDQIVISNFPILVPEPTSVALLVLGSVLMLRPRR
jgi:hypothetical protein